MSAGLSAAVERLLAGRVDRRRRQPGPLVRVVRASRSRSCSPVADVAAACRRHSAASSRTAAPCRRRAGCRPRSRPSPCPAVPASACTRLAIVTMSCGPDPSLRPSPRGRAPRPASRTRRPCLGAGSAAVIFGRRRTSTGTGSPRGHRSAYAGRSERLGVGVRRLQLLAREVGLLAIGPGSPSARSPSGIVTVGLSISESGSSSSLTPLSPTSSCELVGAERDGDGVRVRRRRRPRTPPRS